MRAKEFITEIGYADGGGDNIIDDDTLISSSQVIGDIDNRDVRYSRFGDQDVIFFESNNKVDAFVVLINDNLRAIKNITGVGGLVTALIMFLIKKPKIKITIPNTEELTPHGFEWLTKLIASGGRGLTLSTNDGKYPNIDSLKKEWLGSREDWRSGPTEIVIECRSTNRLRVKSDRMLMPITQWVSDKGLL